MEEIKEDSVTRLYTKVIIGLDGIPRKRCSNPNCPLGEELLPLDFFFPSAQVKSGIDARCQICEAKQKRIWFENNRDKHRESSKKYSAKNRDKIRARVAKWASDNAERRRIKGREFKRKTADKIKIRERENLLSDPSRHWTRRAVIRCKSRAKKEEALFNIDSSDLLPLPEFCSVFGIKLDYLGGSVRREWASVDRIIPSLGYVKGNVRVISQAANWAKSNSDGDVIKTYPPPDTSLLT
jgi:hypothetical protein